MPSREELLASGPRAYLVVGHRMQVPIASPDGLRVVNQWVNPGDLLPRADFDRFPERSRGSMRRTGFVKDPLTPEFNARTGERETPADPKPSRTVLRKGRTISQLDPKTGEMVTIQDPGGLDRRLQRQTVTVAGGATVANLTDTQTDVPAKRKRGRPRKVRT